MKSRLINLGFTVEDLWQDGYAQVSSRLCSIVGICRGVKDTWISCTYCPAYEEYGISEQLLAILLGYTDK